MKKYTMIILACAFAITAVLFFNFIRLHSINDKASLPTADAKELPSAPDFILPDLNQESYTLSSDKDKHNILVLFWTTWCQFCPAELRELNSMYSNLAKEGTQILAINAGERLEQVKNFVNRHKLSYRVLLDTDKSVARLYGVFGVPTYFLIDKSGRIVFKGNYFPNDKYKELISK